MHYLAPQKITSMNSTEIGKYCHAWNGAWQEFRAYLPFFITYRTDGRVQGLNMDDFMRSGWFCYVPAGRRLPEISFETFAFSFQRGNVSQVLWAVSAIEK